MVADELSYLYGLAREGIKLDLSVTREFSGILGNPEQRFRTFHVAGTNGKGSTSAYVYNILMKKYSSGLYTSPHLIKFNERILMNRELIKDQEIEKFVAQNRSIMDGMAQSNRNPTFFEATTMLAFMHFADSGAQYASIEVGLGGRLDSTNIVNPEVSIITQIGYEHFDKLGCSLTSISMEKGGIIKPNVPVVLGDTKPEVVSTIRRLAEVRQSKFIHVPANCEITDLSSDLTGTAFVLKTPKKEYKLKTSMIGNFQPRNAATAILAIENSGADKIMKRDIESGIRNTRWPGRMEIIRKDPRVMVDCAHNPPAANALKNSLSEYDFPNPLLVIGILSDKDSYSYLHAIRGISDRVIFTLPNEPMRAMPPEKLASMSSGLFRESEVINDPIEAYEKAISSSDLVLVTGSMYLVGAIMEHEGKSVMPFHND
ncbi:MAG: bifunctional folylpolyglutamate synthase/dihydrofolate synthase [Candidatus Thermoplasmatota archaeon]|nr:bifunctional folylpolyglutamate synthase/dihydrofolate synthase [Candidatus Thermoplasmatota archaeon]